MRIKINFEFADFPVKNAQSIIEYAVYFTIIVTALLTMSVYVRRAIQANIKTVENQINASIPDSQTEELRIDRAEAGLP